MGGKTAHLSGILDVLPHQLQQLRIERLRLLNSVGKISCGDAQECYHKDTQDPGLRECAKQYHGILRDMVPSLSGKTRPEYNLYKKAVEGYQHILDIMTNEFQYTTDITHQYQ